MKRNRTERRMADVPRVHQFTLTRAEGEGAEAGDGLTLDGWGSVFRAPTIIDSWEGRFFEEFMPGSMKKSFRESTPRIQFDHGRHPLIGSIPIASFTPGYPREETDPTYAPNGGAHVVARLIDNWLIAPVRDAIAAGAIDGMSHRFQPIREKWFTPDGKQITDAAELEDLLLRSWLSDLPDEELLRREIHETKVLEIGPVVWPAYESTSVGVRSLTIDLGRLTEPAERNKLAHAVYLAERAEVDAPQDTPPLGAVEHAGSLNDAPQDTPAPGAVEHPSTPPARKPANRAAEWRRGRDSVRKLIPRKDC